MITAYILIVTGLAAGAALAQPIVTTPFEFSPRALRSATLATTTPRLIAPGATYDEYVDSPPHTRGLPSSAMHLSCSADVNSDCGTGSSAFYYNKIVKFSSKTGNYDSVRFETSIKNTDTKPHMIMLELYTEVPRKAAKK